MPPSGFDILLYSIYTAAKQGRLGTRIAQMYSISSNETRALFHKNNDHLKEPCCVCDLGILGNAIKSTLPEGTLFKPHTIDCTRIHRTKGNVYSIYYSIVLLHINFPFDNDWNSTSLPKKRIITYFRYRGVLYNRLVMRFLWRHRFNVPGNRLLHRS